MIKSLATAIISFILAFWMVAIAILSIQNVFVLDATGESTLVSLKFLGMSSIYMPFGVILAASAAIGTIATGIIMLPLSGKTSKSSPRNRFQPKRGD